MINKISITLSIAAVSAAVSLAQPALADPSSARFDYAPNVWKEDVAPKKKQYAALSNPMAGRAPSNMLFGNGPSILAKPAPLPAPVKKPVLAPILTSNPFVHAQMQQSFGKPVAPSVPVAPPAVAFKAAFGSPLEVKPPVVAMQPKPQTAPPVHEAKSPAARPSAGRYIASSNLHGKMFKPAVLTGNHAAAASLPQIASYAPNVGYSSGALLPHATSGSGGSSVGHVTGKVIGQH